MKSPTKHTEALNRLAYRCPASKTFTSAKLAPKYVLTELSRQTQIKP
jgi:hypothetical protein